MNERLISSQEAHKVEPVGDRRVSSDELFEEEAKLVDKSCGDQIYENPKEDEVEYYEVQ